MPYKPRSIVLNNRTAPRIHRTFSDWQNTQKEDLRTPAQRGISVGSPVMWRYMRNNIIVTDHAIVTAISGNTLTLKIKDVKERFESADIHEIVSNSDDRSAAASVARENEKRDAAAAADAAATASAAKDTAS